MKETVYLQVDTDVRDFMENGYCEVCLRPADEWAEENRYGHVRVHGYYDAGGNLVGFLCPDCASQD